jgi:EpsI family protein
MEKTGISKAAVHTLIALLIVFGGLSYLLRYMSVKHDRPAEFDRIPIEHSGWQGEEHTFSEATYEILKATSSTVRSYTHPHIGDLKPTLFIAYFEDQKYGSQIHSPRHCLPGGGWGILSHIEENLTIDDHEFGINRLIIGDRKHKQLMYYWFETRSGTITNEFMLKFDLFKNALFMRPTDAAFIRVTVYLPPGKTEQEGEQILKNFLSDYLPQIENSLPFKN